MSSPLPSPLRFFETLGSRIARAWTPRTDAEADDYPERTARQRLGARGERAAERHLKRLGLRILARGYRIGSGEIDLIARDGDVLVFVEVKTRRQGEPFEAINDAKRRTLTRAALRFTKRYGIPEVPFRFDVVAVVWSDDRRPPQITHYPHAFEALDGPGHTA